MITHLSCITTIVASLSLLASPAAAAEQVNCNELCVESCADVKHAGLYCESFDCGNIGICPGDGGSCDWDWDNEDEQIYCTTAP